MIYSSEVQNMCPVAKGAYHGPAPIPEEGKWVQAKEISDISGLTHGVGWCAPQQGACKLTLNVKNGIIEEALVETIGCTSSTAAARLPSPRAACPSVPLWRIWARVCAVRWAPSSPPSSRVLATCP